LRPYDGKARTFFRSLLAELMPGRSGAGAPAARPHARSSGR